MPLTITVSDEFRKQVARTVWNIVLFIIVYLLLVLAAATLAILCGWAGLHLIVNVQSGLSLMIGIGLIALGVSVFVFLIKFLFARSKDENTDRVEIREAEQPRLFAFIRELTRETNVPFPKKIFLTPEVNAAVFYNSSFLSMFLPARKNLQIGLGLVNSVNISEFKSVMAHEFGHFSQRSMKLGSFTYNVNKVIHNILYDNSGYSNFLSAWGNISNATQIFASITAKIAGGIQWVLRGMYGMVNKSYKALSREMEFHADAVAASVSGGNNLVTALSRADVADSCYNSALREAGKLLKENRMVRNLYAYQSTIFTALAAEHKLPIRNGLPEVSFQFIQSFSRSRIKYNDQWASHPTLKERKSHLDQTGAFVEPDTRSAWTLFDDAEGLQLRLTKDLYKKAPLKDDVQSISEAELNSRYFAHRKRFALPEAYLGYYDDRYIDIKEWNLSQTESAEEPVPVQFSDLFNEANSQLFPSINSNRNDQAIVNAIAQKELDVSTFDFEGVKYPAKKAKDIAGQLQKDIDGGAGRLDDLDKKAYRFFLQQAGNPAVVRDAYIAFQLIERQRDEFMTVFTGMMNSFQPLYGGVRDLATVNTIVRNIKHQHEPAIKEAYNKLIVAGVIIPGTLADRIRVFSINNFNYFENNAFKNEELEELRGLAIAVAEVISERKFARYKYLLVTQLEQMNRH